MDNSLFVHRHGDDMTYILLYVDDIVLTASFDVLLPHIIDRLHSGFAMTDFGDLHDFLHMTVTHSSDRLFLSQR
jgi:hypothetical protein